MTRLLRNLSATTTIALALLALPTRAAHAQSGPTVEVFTSENSGGGSEPFVPLWRLPVRVSVSLSAGYDENVSTTTDQQGSLFTGASMGLNYEFGTSRTRASLSTGTGVTYYPDVGGPQFDPDLNLTLTVSHQVNLRLTVNTVISAHYRAEPDFTTDLSLDRRAGNYFSSQDSFSAAYQWLPRFSTVTGYSLGMVYFENTSVASQNRVDHSFTESFHFLFLPVTTLAADYAVSFVTYDGSDRDSHTQTVSMGFDHSLSATLHGGIRAGAEFRSTDNPAFQSADGVNPYVSANLNYVVGGKTTLGWSANYGTQESYYANAAASLTFRTSLVANYALTPRIGTSISGTYQHNENQGPEFFPGFSTSSTEDSVDLSLGLSYAISRYFSASASYSHTEVESDFGLRSYSRNRYSAGLTVNF
jgi:hypothetical protein